MDDNFKALLTRYLNGTCTAEEREQVEHWYAMIEDQTLSLTERERRIIGERMLENIARSAGSGEHHLPVRRRLSSNTMYATAASIVLAACCIWYFATGPSIENNVYTNSREASSEITIENNSEGVRVLMLPDSSVVRLEALSRIRYARNFSTGNREVHLVGKAFFDIVRDPAHPFYVYSGKIGTRVLGTSFFVDAPEHARKVGVKVLTGKVSVFTVDETPSKAPDQAALKNSTANGVILSPNQKVEYIIEGGHWVTGLVEDPLPVKPIEVSTSHFVFSNAQIGNILSEINDRYEIEVISENEGISECTFTGDVSQLTLYDMLEVICNAIGATFEVKGTRILISGGNCD